MERPPFVSRLFPREGFVTELPSNFFEKFKERARAINERQTDTRHGKSCLSMSTVTVTDRLASAIQTGLRTCKEWNASSCTAYGFFRSRQSHARTFLSGIFDRSKDRKKKKKERKKRSLNSHRGPRYSLGSRIFMNAGTCERNRKRVVSRSKCFSSGDRRQ